MEAVPDHPGESGFDLDSRTDPGHGRRVLLLHGLWMPRVLMAWHARQLGRAGFQPSLFGYHSLSGGPEKALPALLKVLREPTDIVAHSLGGLIAVSALETHPELPVRRLVCLGSPLRGSAAVRGLERWPLVRAFAGRSAGLLRAGCPPWHGAAELGVVAGDLARGMGRLFGRFPGPSDGTVAVAETRLPGETDHIVLPTSHSGMLLSHAVSQQAIAFLRSGRFRHDG